MNYANKVALVDCDVLTYRIGFTTEEEEEKIAIARMADFLETCIFVDLGCERYKCFITGKNNFRDKIAITAPYKGNRSGNKPKHYALLREYLVDAWSADVAEGMEADDAIAIEHTRLAGDSVICSTDKDFKTVPGLHYDYVKKQAFNVEPFEALKFFYTQILTGDRIDNIIGIRGVGPKKAEKILEGKSTEQEMFQACVEAYKSKDRVIENARLLWLLRQPNEVWTSPEER